MISKTFIHCSRFIVFLCFFILFICDKSYSHPHVWIDTDVTIMIENGIFKGVKNNWRFDEYFSVDVIDAIDLNKNGIIEDDEKEYAFNETFAHLKEYNHYNHLSINKKKITDYRIENFDAKIENGILIYNFEIVLNNPINVSKNNLIFLSIYDDTYFMDIKLGENKNIHFTSTDNLTYKIIEDKNNAIWYGMVFPKTLYIKGIN